MPRLLQHVLLVICLLPVLMGGAVSEAFLEGHRERMDRLFASLDPENRTMRGMRHQWAIGRHREAAQALATYYREKEFPVELLQQLDFPDDLERHAQAALGESFFLLSEWETVARRADGGIDWQDRGERNDKERAWMLNRHGFLPDLAEAWERSGERRYREQLNTLLQDWILSNPYPDRLTFSPPWRALEVARRILNAWVHVFYGYDVLDDETRLLVLASLLDHGDALREHASFWGGNHLISEKLALLTLTAAWPELASTKEWREHAIQTLTDEFFRQSYPDGSYRELSNHYQRVVLVNAQYFLNILTLIEEEPRGRPVGRRIEQMWDFFAGVMRPDGTGPLSNASDLEYNAAFLEEAWGFFDREDWRYMASGGELGTPPDGPPSRLFPWAGQAILRNAWDRDADWVYFDAGPYGSAHQHVDRLQVSASLNGKSWLVDTGRYTYQPGPWRDYFKGPEGHNTLTLDGLASHQGPRIIDKPMPVAIQTKPAMSFAAAMSHFEAAHGMAGLTGTGAETAWTRAVLLEENGIVLVLDHLVTFQAREVEARWHFHPAISKQEAVSSMRLMHPETFRLRMERGQDTPAIAGWYSPDYNERHPAWRMTLGGRIARPTTLVWILQEPGDPPVELEILSDPGAPVFSFRLIRENGTLAEGKVRLHPRPELLHWQHP